MVTMMPPGSLPGMINFSTAPTITPNTIHTMLRIRALLQGAASPDALPRRWGGDSRGTWRRIMSSDAPGPHRLGQLSDLLPGSVHFGAGRWWTARLHRHPGAPRSLVLPSALSKTHATLCSLPSLPTALHHALYQGERYLHVSPILRAPCLMMRDICACQASTPVWVRRSWSRTLLPCGSRTGSSMAGTAIALV
jgi:hypothetical protein